MDPSSRHPGPLGPDLIETIAHHTSAALEVLGIAIIIAGAVWATGGAARALLRGGAAGGHDLATQYRHRLARAILVGLEPLVAVDIINTVALELNLRSVLVLVMVVLIRMILSFTLELEITGKWPWQKERAAAP